MLMLLLRFLLVAIFLFELVAVIEEAAIDLAVPYLEFTSEFTPGFAAVLRLFAEVGATFGLTYSIYGTGSFSYGLASSSTAYTIIFGYSGSTSAAYIL